MGINREMSIKAQHLNLISCHHCQRVVARDQSHCPRCNSRLHPRKPDSFNRAWALLLAALVFYIPANLLPVMNTTLLGKTSASTILGGVAEFWHAGAWDIALIIFVASVLVPCTKFLVLGFLLLSSQFGYQKGRRARARLYRLVELIGYWSMLDVIVVALVSALVRFHNLSHVVPEPGILFFGLVVLLTMLCSMSFDPRYIWDDKEPHGQQ
ncbi:paraquat-inducible protein A [Gallaecimonas mangrovi]|uniref:paraquat-inducible protein A n=1 Tax=Gallaecimonas mangrovi TaxID=2291597 RepID=UPI001D01FA55|nr:paraquat-inducible protein A [Gallaecimonas mangrovi]